MASTKVRNSPSGPEVEVIEPEGQTRLSNVIFADGGSTLIDETGLITEPFHTITDAIALANTLSGGKVVATAGDYSSEGSLDLRCDIGCWQSPIILPGGGSSDAQLVLGAIAPGAAVNVQIEGAEIASFTGATSTLTLNGCESGAISCATAYLNDTTVSGDITCTGVFNAINSDLGTSHVTFAGTATLVNCDLDTGFTITCTGARGTLIVDDYTQNRLINSGYVITNCDVVALAGQQEFCNVWIPAIFDGSGTNPGNRYTQTTAIASGQPGFCDVGTTGRQTHATKNFTVSTGTAGPIVTYNGPIAIALFTWRFMPIILVNPAVPTYGGIVFNGQTAPKFENPITLSGVTNAVIPNAGGSGQAAIVPGLRFSPGYRMTSAGGILANAIGYGEMSFTCTVVGLPNV